MGKMEVISLTLRCPNTPVYPVVSIKVSKRQSSKDKLWVSKIVKIEVCTILIWSNGHLKFSVVIVDIHILHRC